MADLGSRSKVKRVAGSLAVVGMMSTGALATLAVVATPAGAQATKINSNDFIDPVTGEFDLEAYLAAVAAANAGGSDGAADAVTTTGNLPYTGSNSQDLLLAGVAIVVTGGAAAFIASRRRAVRPAATTPAA